MPDSWSILTIGAEPWSGYLLCWNSEFGFMEPMGTDGNTIRVLPIHPKWNAGKHLLWMIRDKISPWMVRPLKSDTWEMSWRSGPLTLHYTPIWSFWNRRQEREGADRAGEFQPWIPRKVLENAPPHQKEDAIFILKEGNQFGMQFSLTLSPCVADPKSFLQSWGSSQGWF